MRWLLGILLLIVFPATGLPYPPPETPTCPERFHHEKLGITYFEVETNDQTIFYIIPPLTIDTITSTDREGTDIRLIFPLTYYWSDKVLETLAKDIRYEQNHWIEALRFEPIPHLGISGFLKLGANKKDWNKNEFNPRHINYLGNSITQEHGGQLFIRIPPSLRDAFDGSQKGDFLFEFYLFPQRPVPGIPNDCWPITFTVPLGAIPDQTLMTRLSRAER